MALSQSIANFRDRRIHMVLDGVLKEGDPLPSVRTVAAEFRVNPLTVLKAYQQLVDEVLVQMERGLGMFVKPGARDQLLRGERQKFLTDEWPRIAERSRGSVSRKEIWIPQQRAARRPANVDHGTYRSTRSSEDVRHDCSLDSIDLHIEESRILGLIGPNGAGKTTALMRFSD